MKNLVLIVADTVRRDHLPFHAATDVHAPNLAALATRSSVLDRYYAAGFPTMPTRADLFLGQWTFASIRWEPLPENAVPLARILTNAGFVTAAAVDTPFYTNDGFGYDRGFKYFCELRTQPGSRRGIPQPRATEYDYCAPQTFVTAEQLLEGFYDTPFFLLIDTWDPHEPWDPPPHYVRRYLPDWDGRVVNPVYDKYQRRGVTKEDLAVAHACYKAEITMVDRWIGRLLERLESLGIADETAVLFTTDHGFYFGDYGYFGKTARPEGLRPGQGSAWARSPLYEALVHIPFVAHVPGAPSKRLPQLLSAIDVMPTILDLLGVPVPAGLELHGRSFAPLLRGESTALGFGPNSRDFVVSSVPLANPGEMLGIVDGWKRSVAEFLPATITANDGWSLLYAASGEPAELYRLPDDPAQTCNLAGEQTAVVEALHRNYVDLLKEVNTPAYLLDPRTSV